MHGPGARGRLLGLVAFALSLVAVIPAATAGAAAPADTGATFADQPIGAAAGVSGGAGGEVRVVSNLEGKGAGSLRAAAEAPGPAIVLFAVSGKIVLGKPIAVASNLTIDGRGADVTLVSRGLLINGSSNVIVRNLKVRQDASSDSNDDAVGVQGGARGVWIDHMDLAGFQDGLIDVVEGSTNVTLSWNKLAEHGKTMLLGSNVQEGTPDLVDITVHHNLYEGTGERNPMVRQARVHVFNNVLEAWGYSADSGYGMRSDCGGIVLVEANVFRPSGNKRATTVRDVGCDPTRPPALREQSNDLGGAQADQAQPAAVTAVDRSPVTPEPATPTLLAAVKAGAGWQKVANPIPIPAPSSSGPTSTSSAAGANAAPSTGGGVGPVVVLVVGALVFGAGVGAYLSRQRSRRAVAPGERSV